MLNLMPRCAMYGVRSPGFNAAKRAHANRLGHVQPAIHRASCIRADHAPTPDVAIEAITLRFAAPGNLNGDIWHWGFAGGGSVDFILGKSDRTRGISGNSHCPRSSERRQDNRGKAQRVQG